MVRFRLSKLLIPLVGLAMAIGLYATGRFMTRGAAEPDADSASLFYEPIDATEKRIAFYESRVERDPIDAASRSKLAGAFVQRARETGDVSYYERAGRLVEESLAILPEESNYAAVVLSGAVAFSLHQFETARDRAQRALTIKPRDAYLYGQLGDAYVELGDYDRAADAYRSMIRLGKSLYSYSRWAHFKDLMGDPPGAIKAMSTALEAGRQSARTPRENLAWCQTQLGDLYFNTGQLDAAETNYSAALEAFPSYHPALAGLAKVKTAHHQDAEAVDLYRRAIARVPDPEIVAALGDLYGKLGQRDEAKEQYDLVEYIGTLAKINRTVYNRQLARFYADHDHKLDEALALAQNELEMRRDIYGYDTLAWALYKHQRYEDALSAIKQALRLGTQDARLYFHAGMIQARLGHRMQASEALNRALRINPYFHVLHADEARHMLEKLKTHAEFADRAGKAVFKSRSQSHQRQLVDRSGSTYHRGMVLPESHQRQLVDRSGSTFGLYPNRRRDLELSPDFHRGYPRGIGADDVGWACRDHQLPLVGCRNHNDEPIFETRTLWRGREHTDPFLTGETDKGIGQ